MKKEDKGNTNHRRHLFGGKFREKLRRLTALALSVSMVASGMPSIPAWAAVADDSETVFTVEPEDVEVETGPGIEEEPQVIYEYEQEEEDNIWEFYLTADDLIEAMREAALEDNPISESALRFTGAEADAYDELFYWNDVYELFPEIDKDRGSRLSLRIFTRFTGDRSLDSFEIDGSEEIIFLLLNNTDDEQKARIYIDEYDSGLICVVPKGEVLLEKEDLEIEEITEEEAIVAEDAAAVTENIETVQSAGPAVSGGAGSAGSGSSSAAASQAEVYPAEESGIPEGTYDYGSESAGYESSDAYIGTDSGYEDADTGYEGEDASYTDGEAYGDGSVDSGYTEDTQSAGDEGYSSDESNDSEGYTDSSDSSYSGSEDYGSSYDDGNAGQDDGSASSDTSDSGYSDDTGSDSGSDYDAGSNDTGSSDSGSNDFGSNDSGNSDSGSSDSGSSDSSSSDSGSSDDGTSMAAISGHSVGLLTAALNIADDEEIKAEPEDDNNDTAYEDDEEIIIGSDEETSDDFIIRNTELASPSNAKGSDEDSNDDDSDDSDSIALDGETYEAVLVNGRRSAVAFVTTLEDLGVEPSRIPGIRDIILEDQTVEATIYADEFYDWRLADGTSITLSGMLPENAEVKAYPVEVEIEDIHVLAAYDITIYDRFGEEYQPEDDTIEVAIENDEIREALVDYERELTIFHMEDEYDEPEEIAVIEPEARMKIATFSAERFSIYVVGEDDQLYEADHETPHYIYTVNFYIEDMSDDPISSQTLSAGEYVEVPGVPEVEHAVFIGWFTKPNGGGTLYDLSTTNVLPGITEDTELDLFAHYTDVYYVYYMEFPYDTVFEEGQENVVFHTEVYNEYDAALDTSTATDLYRAEGLLAATEAVTGWVDVDGNPAPEKVEDDLELYPVIDNAYWIYFDVGEDMQTSVDPIYVLASSTTIGDLPDASCTGYTFDGWYTDTTYRTRVTSSTTLASLNLGTGEGQEDSVTLYAKWTAAKVAYTVNIWRQKATDGKTGIDQKTYTAGESYDDFIDYYDFAESFHVTAANSTLYAGDSLANVTPTQTNNFLYSYTRYGTTSDNTSAYYGFEYATNRTQNDVRSITSVAADGSTVINIFYDRVTITWTFGSGSNSNTLIGLYGTNCAQGDDPAGSYNDWPNSDDGTMWRYTSGSSSRYMTFEATFVILSSSTSMTFTSTTRTVRSHGYYYLELTNDDQLDPAKQQEAENYGIPYTRTVNNTEYVYVRRIISDGSDFNLTDKYTGYKVVGYTTVDAGNADTNTSYTEASEGTSIDTSYTSGFIFQTTYYLDFYIFNDARTYTITLVSSEKNVGIADNGTLYDAGNEATYTFKYGADLSDVTFPGTEELDGATWGPAYYYEFDGTWMEDPLFTAKFVIPSSMPANNLVAYADWELKDITVSFVTNTEETTYEDQIIKATETAEDPGTPTRDGYEFVGWMDQNGKIFNFATVLYDDTTLTAIWKDLSAEGHKITYDLNVSNSYGLLDGYEGTTTSTNPEEFASGAEEELWTIETAFPGIASIKGAYDEFICWNTAADGSGTNYYPDDEIEIGNQDITLYAIWANKDRNEATLILDHNYPEGYTPSEGESTIDEITQRNLTDIDLEDESHLTYHEEITVTDSEGQIHYYRFEGWSTTRTDESSATDDDVDFAATDHVAVDTLTDESGNTLYAVWLEVYSITVTKEVVNNATNYTVPEDTTFDFTWSVLTGDGETTTGTESGIADKGTFTISDVATGETVTIAETDVDGFTVSYNGAQGGTTENGAYTFTMGDGSTDITVTNTVKTNQLTVNKVWKDANGDEETNVDHDAVTVTVYEDETSLGELTLSSENGWADSIELVIKSDATYTVSEDSVEGYTTTVSEMTTDETTGDVGFTVTNSEIPYIDIEVTKEWVDDGNRDGLESDSITVQLEIDQKATDPEQTLTLNKDNNWTNTFTDLPKYDDSGKEINYSVEEVEVPNGYTATYTKTDTGWTITNTHEDYIVSEITITKTWDDADNQDDKRPESVKFELQVNGSTVTDQNGESWTVELMEKDAVENNPDTWETTITDHPIYVNESGAAISYILHEDDVAEGYTTSDETVTITPVYANDEETILYYTGTVTITNTHTPEVYGTDGTLTVTKEWDDANNQDGIRPTSVSVTLSAVDSEGKEVTLPESIVATQTITANDNWTATYKGLYKYSNGKEITYTVAETAVTGYTITYDPATTDDGATGSGSITDGAVIITNTHTPETIDIEGSKTWNDSDNQDGKRPTSITIRLMADGSPVTEKTVTAADNWKWSFTDLDKYSNGTEIVYTITENAVTDYTTTYDEGTYDVINSYTPETTTVTITKEWDDDSNRDGKRPSEVTVTLTGTNGSSQDITLNDGNSWTTTVDVPMYYNGGELVVYSVSESTVSGYDAPVVTTTDNYNFVVTNTYTPEFINETGIITVEKVWDDKDDQDGIRPASVEVTLTAVDSEGTEVKLPEGVEATQEITADAEGKWTVTYEGLYKYANGGKEITYSITESAITVPEGHSTGYTPAITGSAESGFTVTNTHTPEVIGNNGTITITKTWNDDSDHDAIRPTSVNFTLTGTITGDENAVVTKSVTLTAQGEWTGTIEGLERYSSGQEITYILTETDPEGYTSTITATTDANGILTGYTVVNSHEDYTATITVTKEWKGDEGYEEIYRPSSVTVHLMSDGVDTNRSVVLTADNEWTNVFKNVPVFEDGDELHGQKITYTVTEENLPTGYTASETESEFTQGDDGNWTETATITNTLTTIGSEENPVKITKEWNDGDIDHTDDSVSVTIYSSNWTKDDDSYYISETYTLSEENEWTVTVSDLPKYTTDSTEIEYVVSEEAIEGYSTQISSMVANDDGSYTFNVTNTALLNETGELKVSKTWDDADNQDGIRSENVTVQLYTGEGENTEVVKGSTLTLASDNNWTDSFTELDQYDADGQEITYTVSETNVPTGYESTVSGTTVEGFTVTNTHTPETIDISGTKTWNDADNQDGKRPTEITINLMNGTTTVNSKTVTANDNWSYTFTGVDKYASGEAINYTINEVAVDDYSTTYDGYNVTNSYTPSKISVTVTKAWEDETDQDGFRPDSVTVTLYADNVNTGKTVTLSEDNSWQDTFTELDEYTSGQEITYTVQEINFVDANGKTDTYEPTVTGDMTSGYTITNTHTPELANETGDITVTKTWDDSNNQDGMRDSYTVILTGTITIDEEETTVSSDTQTLSADTTSYTWKNMPKYSAGVEIEYSVTEAAVPEGYTASYGGDLETGFTVTNTHIPETYDEVKVTKDWVDDNNRDGMETETIEVQLYAGETASGEAVELSATNNWTYTWENLPKYAAGENISYSVKETVVPEGYTETYSGDVENGFTITNTHESKQVSELTITKIWDDADNQDGIRPNEVVVELQINGSMATDVNGNSWSATLTKNDVDADGNWTITVDNHPVYVDEDGKEITYTLHEDTEIEGYEATDGTVEITETTDEDTGITSYTGSVTITNAHTPETVNVEGSKTWDYGNDPDTRPASITIHLLADGTEIDSAEVTGTESWAWSFTNLPKNASGKEITYTITEDAIENYTTNIDGYDVTNTYNPEMTTVTVSKGWDDDSDRDGLRPASVTVTLTGSTNSFSEGIVLNEDNSWTATVDVPMYDNNGNLVEYSVSEEQVENYEEPAISSTSGTSAYNFVVTNKHTLATVDGENGTITVKKVWDDEDDQDGIRPESITVTLYADEDVAHVFTLNEQNKWTDSVSGMYMYANGGQEITYTVSEAEISVPEGHTGYDEPTIAGGADETNDYTFTVTNKHTPELVNETGKITVTKDWVDDNNRDGMETSIEVQLYANGSASGDPVSLTGEEDNWTYTWDETLPKYADGKEITYSVQETTVPEGYTVAYTGDVENGFTITNAHESKTISNLTITKVWDDADNQDGIRPERVTVELQIDGSTATGADGESWIATLTKDDIDADGNWTITVDDHPVYVDENGAEITYTLHEDTITEGYEVTDGTVVITETTDENTGITSYTGVATITNTHELEVYNEDGEITVTKIWDDANDQDGIRPSSVDVTLSAVDEDGEEVVLEDPTRTITATDNWTVTYESLYKYANGGKEIIYTIEEDSVSGYTAAYDPEEAVTDGVVTITNTHIPETVDVVGSKTWDDNNDEDEHRPENITIRLYTGGTEIDSQTVSANENWTWSFEDLDKYADGVEIEYTITEDAIYHYSTTYNGYDITNTHTPGQTSITVTKVWDDVNNHDDVRPESVIIDLLADGEQAIDENGEEIKLILSGESDVWVGAFENLDIYEGDSTQAIEYTILEEGVDTNGHFGDNDEYSSEITGDSSTGFIITNTHDVTDWSVEKKLTNKGTGENDAFKLGETAEFTITVTNTGNTTIKQIYITEALEGATFKEGEGYTLNEAKTVATIENLAEGASVELYAEYEIQEKDLGTELENSVTTSDGDPEDPEPGDKTPIPTEDPDPHLTVTKTTTSTPANGETYALDETIEYEITVTNDGNRTVDNITVEDPLTGDEWKIESLAPNDSKTFEASYKVTEADILAGSVVNEATVTAEDPDNPGDDVPNTPGTDEEPTDEKNDHLTVTKETTSTPENGSTYALGEKIDYTITVTNDGNVTLTDIIVKDDLTGDIWPAEGEESLTLAPGESATFETSYTVTEADIEKGDVLNEATATGTDPQDEEPDEPWEGTDDEPTDDPKPSLYVEKTADVAEDYVAALGDEITYTIYVLNDGNETLTNITITDEMTGDGWTIETLAPGDSETYTTTYVVTEDDILAGTVENIAVAEADNPNDPEDPVDNEGTVDIPTEDPNGHLTVTKETTSEPENGESYALGEEITYEITVTNDGNLTITGITVTDELTGDTWPAEDEESLTLAPGASVTFETSYTVTEEDILNGSVVNEATVEGTSPDPDEPEVPFEPGTDEEPTEEKYDHLTVTKVTTSEPENGSTYALGEEIDYTITVTNDGNVTLTDIIVIDELTGLEKTIDSLAPGESASFDTSYIVTEADIEKGDVLNEAYATGTDPDDEKPDEPWEGTDDDPTDTPHPSLYVEKTADVEEGYIAALGDEITYTIYVLNNGNETLTDITVTDEMTEDEWTITSLAPRGEWSQTATYVVTEDDILAGSITNIAAAKAKNPNYDPDKEDDPDNPEYVEAEDEVEIPTAEKNGHITVTKETTSEPANGEAYILGEEIAYTIVATNDGNLTITDITITDELTGDEWTIDSLDPGESSEVFTTSHKVNEEDILAGSVVNEATVKGTSPDPDEPDVPSDPGTDEEPTEEKNGHITVTKVTISEPENGTAYAIGEEIKYEITVTNDGNLTVTDITVTDELTEAVWTIDSLAPGDSEVFETSYKVTLKDTENGSVINEAAITGGISPDPGNPDVPSTPGTDEEPTEEVDMDFFDLDEEIVPENDGEESPDTWIPEESVNEYDVIQIEMTTYLPRVPAALLETEEVTMTFHNQLDTGLVLDVSEEDFTIDINGTAIDPKYYSIEPNYSVSTLNLIRTLSNTTDDCAFHVIVDLSALYEDGEITEDELDGNSTVRVFFYVDLETTDVTAFYDSTAWYVVETEDEVLHISNEVSVEVWTYEIVGSKVNSVTQEPLAGATFGVYYDETCTDPIIRNNADFTVTSDENGDLLFIGLADGTYYLKELEAPDGYILSSEVITVTLTDGTTTEHVSSVITVGNTPSGSSSTGGNGRHSSGGGGSSGSGSSGSSGSVVGPGTGDTTTEEENGDIWNLLPLPQTGEGNGPLAALFTSLASGLALLFVLWKRRRVEE